MRATTALAYWEMPAIPLLDAHGVGVQVLVQLIEQTDSLDDHVVRAVDVELNLGTRVTVTQTKLGSEKAGTLQTLDELLQVQTASADDLQDGLVAVAWNTQTLLNSSSDLWLDLIQD